MRHVFVETNWVVGLVAPTHLQTPAALELHKKAGTGELKLYLPAISLTEARQPVRTKYQPRNPADALRKYLRWATTIGRIGGKQADIVRVALDQYEAVVLAELDELDARLERLTQDPAIEVFGLTESMLARSVGLSLLDLDLKPFDQAILAAILVRAEQLRDGGVAEISFCELDSDLQPWHKNGESKHPLAGLYDAAHIWVYGDFSLSSPERPSTFPHESQSEFLT
jgi:hypothetical protein